MDTGVESLREIPIKEITTQTDTRDILAHCKIQGEQNKFDEIVIVDTDAHHMEIESWGAICEYIEDEVQRMMALDHLRDRTGSPPYGINGDLALRYQDIGGRVPHQAKLGEVVEDNSVHRDVTLIRRAIESFHLDYMVVFPTPMLNLGMHPQFDMEALLGRAYDKWFCENILPMDPKMKTMLFVPFNDPHAALKTVEELGDHPDVVGFMVTSVRHKPVHHNDYMKVYRAMEETGKPLGFHAGYNWSDPSMLQINRFGTMHALSFVWCNVVHMSNWVMNGMPERFPGLDVIWIESGLAWVTWLMQRLDHTYLMRSSEAPMLKKLPSEYMAEMFYTCQPMETDHREALEVTLKMINAKDQLLYASDWPHWDFDAPSVIWDLPMLDDQAKKNILGENAMKLFGLERPAGK